MNLKNFERIVESRICGRGFHYYENDSVVDIEQVEKGEFVATVEGSEEYNVCIKINEHLAIISHSCDCPYDWGTVCKHEVAVMYYLKGNQLYNQPLTESTFSKMKKDLSQLEKEELLEIILDLSKKSKLVKEYMMWELGYKS